MNRFIELINMPQVQMSVADKLELQSYVFGIIISATIISLFVTITLVRLRK